MIDKPKAGFQIPLVDKHLSLDKLDDDIFDVGEVLNIKREFYAGVHTLVNVLWFILMFQMWREMEPF